MIEFMGLRFEDCPECGRKVNIVYSYNDRTGEYKMAAYCPRGCSVHDSVHAAKIDLYMVRMLAERWAYICRRYRQLHPKPERHRLKPCMSGEEIAYTMSEGNPGALSITMKLLTDNSGFGFRELLTLDNLGIYGVSLYKLWNDCCQRDMNWFTETIKYLRTGTLPLEIIYRKLEEPRAEPFIAKPEGGQADGEN